MAKGLAKPSKSFSKGLNRVLSGSVNLAEQVLKAFCLTRPSEAGTKQSSSFDICGHLQSSFSVSSSFNLQSSFISVVYFRSFLEFEKGHHHLHLTDEKKETQKV